MIRKADLKQKEMIEVGDFVQAIDELTEGVVQRIENDTVYLKTSEGFILSFLKKKVVKIGEEKITFNRQDYLKISADKDQEQRKKRHRYLRKNKNIPFMEVDLHIEKLVPPNKELDNFEMINIQLDAARGQLEFAIRNRIPKVIFIHGIGEGVLKAELRTLLNRYSQVQYYEADYYKYGGGATEVDITDAILGI